VAVYIPISFISFISFLFRCAKNNEDDERAGEKVKNLIQVQSSCMHAMLTFAKRRGDRGWCLGFRTQDPGFWVLGGQGAGLARPKTTLPAEAGAPVLSLFVLQLCQKCALTRKNNAYFKARHQNRILQYICGCSGTSLSATHSLRTANRALAFFFFTCCKLFSSYH